MKFKFKFPNLRLLTGTAIISLAAAVAIGQTYTAVSNDYFKLTSLSGSYHDVNFFSAVASAVTADTAVQPCGAGNVTVVSGFGTNAAITYTGGGCGFQMNPGTTAASNGVIGLPVNAAHGWACLVNDETTTSNALIQTKETNSTTNTVTIDGFQSNSAAGNWAANDVIVGQCEAY